MVEILAYAFGIMYTPGPVNLLSLNEGLNGRSRASLGFCIGVGLAMLGLFLLFGYTGAWLVNSTYQLLISALGCSYIFYLGWKIARASVQLDDQGSEDKQALTFRHGLLMQLLNPKAPVAILPIVTVQFPAAGISGTSIALWSILLSFMAFGAPGSYLLMGSRLGQLIRKPAYFHVFNSAMALLLFYVAAQISYQQVYLPLV